MDGTKPKEPIFMALNYYRLLGVPPDSGQQKIKSAYRSLAKRFHPDRNKGSETAAELFRQVNHAYRVLSDPALRKSYDQKLARQENHPPQPAATRPKKRAGDPQQKFNHFVKSLLDAMFGPADSATAPQPHRRVVSRPPRPEKPAFNFHYNLAMEKNSAPYVRGKDGVFRKARPHSRPKH
jgi:curved DNA-binding protein CbpA